MYIFFLKFTKIIIKKTIIIIIIIPKVGWVTRV